ncbi:MAG: substrate-binding domain-containing protein [Rhodobacteraceae bacterium]|nr:substrate-binding domain-containing protein [Paracoccaceae bacterium]
MRIHPNRNITLGALAGGIALFATAAAARDHVQIAGSSTVLPYASIVAEAFGENTDFPTPIVESGGSSAGLKRFCEGIGTNTVDIANSSRAIKDSEVERCAENGVSEIIEVRIGYDGIVFASIRGGHDFQFTQADWFLALADEVLIDGEMVPNPHKTWADVREGFPARNLIAYIPGTKHGTREVFEDKVILEGCQTTGALQHLAAHAEGDSEKDRMKAAEKACISLRTDGVVVDIDGDYTETLTSIESNSDGIGVFGLSFYENNRDTLDVATMAGIVPNTESIAEGVYPVSRPLFFYVKKAHVGVIPGLAEYVEFFLLDEIAGPDGPLAAYGLVSDPELTQIRDEVLGQLR